MRQILNLALIIVFGAFIPNSTNADGNVSISVVNNELRIVGDAKPNQIKIISIEQDKFEIFSVANTTLNNTKQPSLIVDDVNSFSIDMNHGDDGVEMYHDDIGLGAIPGRLTIEMGVGNDYVYLDRFWTNSNAIILMDDGSGTKQGDDTFIANEFKVNQFLYLSTGGGRDNIEFLTVTPDGWNTALAGAMIDTGWEYSDSDEVHMDRLFTWGGINLWTSQSHDNLFLETVLVYNGNLQIETGKGNDYAVVRNASMNWVSSNCSTGMAIDLGGGTNVLYMREIEIEGSIIVQSGNDNDKLIFEDVYVGLRLIVDSNGGDDLTYLVRCNIPYSDLNGGKQLLGDDLWIIDSNIGSAQHDDWETIHNGWN